MIKSFFLLLVLAALLPGQMRRADPPASKESGMPYVVTGPDGAIYVSYIDYLGAEGHAFRFSRWDGRTWSTPETIAQGKNWFVNWADYPTIAVLPDGAMLAHWLTRYGGEGKYGYGIRVAKRDASTRKWREVYGMSLDDPKDYAGFLSFLPQTPGAVYLAPPAKPEDSHRKTVRYVSFGPAGEALKDLEIDADACSCCQTAIGATSDGFIAAYRDHQPGEIRDIAIVRFTDGTWTKPATLHPDGWKINGCPTDGPSIATRAKNASVVWLTRANENPKVQVALSKDNGAHFAAPVRIDDGKPLGRASIVVLDDKNYLVTWIEKTGDDGKAEIRIKRVSLDGQTSESVVTAEASTSRLTGFPKLAVNKDQILVAWREGNIRAVTFNVNQFRGKDSK
ncbi:MAG: sialidase family protein [Acidobacteria bacterium]|nr:sialidase family protein [Acidobacteriota bacterium]